MAPEQFAGGEVDPRADQFAFCVTLYRGVYGRRPFEGADFGALRAAVIAGDVVPPPGKAAPAWLRRAILRGLRPDPADRHPSMRALLEACTRDRRQRRVQWVGIAVSAVLGAGVATIVLRPQPTDSDRATVETVVAEAKAAAARAAFIYPPPDDPEHATAYERVLELEAMTGPAAELADAAAAELRAEFAQTLVGLGDHYWDREGGAAFASDYYGAAVMFEPEAGRARERMMLTPGQLATLEAKARTSDFSAQELAAAELLAALAEEDEDARRTKVARLSPPPATVQHQLAALVGEPEAVAAEPAPPPKHPPSLPEPALAARDESPRRGATSPDNRRASESAPSSEGTVAAAKRDPTAADGEVRLGRAALAQGRAQQASEHFHRALHHDPRSAAAVSGLSEFHFERGEFTQAVRHAERAVRLAPKNAAYRLSLGDAYLKVMRYADAAKAYESAKSLGHAHAQSRLDRLHEKLGQ
jgi:tetratricopeptide (TPR) repeat protein